MKEETEENVKEETQEVPKDQRSAHKQSGYEPETSHSTGALSTGWLYFNIQTHESKYDIYVVVVLNFHSKPNYDM